MRRSGLTRLSAWNSFTRGLRAACAREPAKDAKQILHIIRADLQPRSYEIHMV